MTGSPGQASESFTFFWIFILFQAGMNALHTKEQEKYRSSMLYVHKSDESYVVTLSTGYISVSFNY